MYTGAALHDLTSHSILDQPYEEPFAQVTLPTQGPADVATHRMSSDNLSARLQAVLGDGFQIERELSPGGMSRLFLATERSLNRSVVVKVLPPDAMDSVAENRFRREAELLAKLQHPHIVPVLSVGWSQDLAYYVMPFVEGESLAARLARDGSFDVERGVALIREIADALGHAHSMGVIHRDVKPANVLLAAGHAIVTDFGIARVDASRATKLTSTGVGLGTIGYMAPEQIVGASEVDARADIFALGVVGYELLTGRSPFATSSDAPLLAPQLRGRPAHPSGGRTEIPKSVGDALLRAIEPDPSARFATMEEFRDALPKTTSVRGRLRAKHWALFGAATVVAASLLAILLPRRGNDSEANLLSRVVAPTQQGQPQSKAPDRPLVSVIAVAPFDVMRADLGIWREGMVDVLSRNLDGMGDLRAISPTTVLQSWRGRSDAASAAKLGKAVRAQVVVYGALRTDGDSVRAQATLYDVATGQQIGDVERGDAATRIDRLADSLTVEIVRALDGPRGRRGPHLGSVGTRSMPALKAFLQGQHYMRRAIPDSALIFFRRATEIDTGFALAYHGVAHANTWIPDHAQVVIAQRAAAKRNRGLSERDSLVLALDALAADARDAPRDRAAFTVKVINEIRKLLVRYPADAELLALYGDVVFHSPLHDIPPITAREQIALFDKSIAADSGWGEAYSHAMQLSVLVRDTKRLAKYFGAIEGNPRLTGLASSTSMVKWFTAAPGRTPDECRRWADTVKFTNQYAGAFISSSVNKWVDTAGSVARCMETLATKPPSANDDRPMARLRAMTGLYLRARGLLTRAAAFDPAAVTPGASSDYAMLAMAGVFDPDSASQLARRFADVGTDQLTRQALWGFWLWRKDTVTLANALATERNLRDKYPGFAPEQVDRAIDALRDAISALIRGDTARAIRLIEGAPNAPARIEAPLRSIILPTLYERTGRIREARTLLDRPNFSFSSTALAVLLVELRIGQLSERLGDRERAAIAYSYVLDGLHEAEPSFAPLVRDALEGLRRTGDSRGVVRN